MKTENLRRCLLSIAVLCVGGLIYCAIAWLTLQEPLPVAQPLDVPMEVTEP